MRVTTVCKHFVSRASGVHNAKTPRRITPAGRFHIRNPIDYSDSISSSMFTGIGAFSSSIGITLEGVSGRGG